MSFSLRSTAISSCALLALLVPAEAANTSRAQADSFAKKIAIINQQAEQTGKSSRRTTLTETELNSWFIFRAQPLLPEGVKDPRVVAVGGGRLQGTVTVDLEDVGRSRSSEVLKYLGGRVPISLSGTLRAKEGRGQFDLQSAQISGIPLPKFLLQEIVSHYTRGDERPNGIRLDDPFALPANIKQIDVGQGQAVVIQ